MTKRKDWKKVKAVGGLYQRADKKGRKRYCCDFELGGKRYKKALGTNREDAIRQIESIRRRARLAAQGLADNNHPLRLLYEEFIAVCESDLRASTVTQYEGSFKQLWKHFDKKKRVSDLTPALAERYKAKREREGVSPRTIRLELTVFNAMLNYGVKANTIERNPFAGVKLPKCERSEKGIWADAEYAMLIDHEHRAGSRGGARECCSRDLWVMLWETGTQPQEMTSLEWGNVDLDGRAIHIVPTTRYGLKSRKRERAFPIESKPLLEMLTLKKWHAGKAADDPHSLVFPGESGQQISKDQLRRRLVRCLKACGIDANGRSPYSFRHTFCTRMLQAGVSPMILKKLMGHSTTRMIDVIYEHLQLADSRAAMKQVASAPAKMIAHSGA